MPASSRLGRSTAPSRPPPASRRPNIAGSRRRRPNLYITVIAVLFWNRRTACRFGQGDFQIRRAAMDALVIMSGTRFCVMPEAPVKRRNLILILASTTALSALALSAARARDVPKVATGFVANILCSETFVSGQQPERIFRETTAAMPGARLITWALDYQVDRARKDATVTFLRLSRSQA